MKNILITLLICIVSPIVALAEIDERKTDIYFANGILTDEGNATANTIMLKNAVKDEFYNGSLIKMQKRIGKVTEAYNSTHGEVADLSLVPPLPRWNAYSNNKGNTWAEAAIKYMNRHTHTS